MAVVRHRQVVDGRTTLEDERPFKRVVPDDPGGTLDYRLGRRLTARLSGEVAHVVGRQA